MKSSAEKLRTIVNWANFHNESFLDRIKTVEDLIKLYDYCMTTDYDFLDDESLSYMEYDDLKKIKKEVKELLGYSPY